MDVPLDPTVTSVQSNGGLTQRKGTTATQRLKQDYLRLIKDPVPYVTAHPLPSNILEWHYVVRGPEGTPYEGGIYHGKLAFPFEFPFKPPAIYMMTPNGRFKTNIRLCLSISDYHPDTWNPAWSVATILTGLLSFMIETNPTMGSIETSEYEKRMLAKQSLDFNLGNKVFVELFPDLVDEIKEKKRLALAAASSGDKNKSLVTERVTELGNTIRSHGIRAGQNAADNGIIGNLISTTVVVTVFVAFLYTVRYVLHSINGQSST